VALGGRTSSYDQILLVRYVLACPNFSKLCLQKQQVSGCKSIQTSEYGALFVGITGDLVRYPGETLSKDKSYELPKSGATVPEVPELRINKKDYRPASSYLPLQEGEFRILQLDPGENDNQNISFSFVIASVE
jgi:hypothetical protein